MTVFFFAAPIVGILLLLRLVYISGQLLTAVDAVYDLLAEEQIDHDDIMLGDYSEGEE